MSVIVDERYIYIFHRIICVFIEDLNNADSDKILIVKEKKLNFRESLIIISELNISSNFDATYFT